jgi:hypothetical protein
MICALPVTVEPFQFSPAEPVAYELSYRLSRHNLEDFIFTRHDRFFWSSNVQRQDSQGFLEICDERKDLVSGEVGAGFGLWPFQ